MHVKGVKRLSDLAPRDFEENHGGPLLKLYGFSVSQLIESLNESFERRSENTESETNIIFNGNLKSQRILSGDSYHFWVPNSRSFLSFSSL